MDSGPTVDELCRALGVRIPAKGIEIERQIDNNSQSQDIDEEIGLLASEAVENFNKRDSGEIIIDGSQIQVGDSIEIDINSEMSIEKDDTPQVCGNVELGPAQRSLNEDNESMEHEVQLNTSGLSTSSQLNTDGSIFVQHDDVFHGEPVRIRKSKSKPEDWKRNISKINREMGREYLGFQNTVTENENNEILIKAVQKKVMPAVKMGPKCKSNLCKSSKLRQCNDISEEDRVKLHNEYWNNMSWAQRRVYIPGLIDKSKVKVQTRGKETNRKETLHYFLKINDHQKLQVCKFMFMSTLNVTTRQINQWVNKPKIGATKPAKSSANCHNKKTLEQAKNSEYLNEFLNKLPKMPSHYNRKNSTKLYLEPIFNSVAHLFGVYKNHCKDEGQTPVSRWKFDETLSDMNISLFQPKKDQCDLCTAHENGNISTTDYESHLLKKDRARSEKNADKEESKLKKCYVLTMDLESVKVAPYLQASALYYKTKLAVHNFTIYNLASNHATCYWWDESESELVASAFATCLVDYITDHCEENLPIIIYSDGCTYQNRNSIISNALLSLSMNTSKIIIQKYLEKGHTQMECDSVHSAIECKLKNRVIHLPSDYYKICQEARTKPFPYEVKPLTFDFFRDYSRSEHTRYKSIRPGKKVGDSTVTDIRALKYTPDGLIFFKLNFDDDWEEIPVRPKQIQMPVFPSLYESRINIKPKKYQDLQELKSILPFDCHSFYDNLPH